MTEDSVYEPVISAPPPEAAASEPVISQPTPDPEPTQPVEVVSVDELVDRLTSETDTSQEELAEEEVPVDGETSGEIFSEPVYTGPLEIAGMDQLLRDLETVTVTVDHSALDTPFEEYTVTEGLLLLLLVLVVASWCVKMIKGGFSWLLW